MKIHMTEKVYTIEELCDWFDTVPGTVEVPVEDARNLGKLIRTLYEDNRLIYNSEDDFKRND
jgi:hypothetical protein